MKEFFVKNVKVFQWMGISLGFVAVLFLIALGTSMAMFQQYENKIFPGTRIDGLPVGGLNKTQASQLVTAKFNQVYSNGFNFNFLDTTKTIENKNDEILALNTESMVATAYDSGRYGSWLRQHIKILVYPIIRKEIKLDYTLNKNILKERVQAAFALQEKKAKDSTVIVNVTNAAKKEYTLDFTESYTGETFNYNEAIEKLDQEIKKMANPIINLQKRTEQPKVTRDEAVKFRDQIVELLKLDNIEFVYEEKEWPITWEDFTHWLILGQNNQEKVALIFNKEMVSGRIEAIAQEINRAAQDARLQMEGGRVTEFKASETGLEVDLEKSFEAATASIIGEKKTTSSLVVNVTEPNVRTETINNLGIKEKIGVGVSNFSGSPANRRHNIGVGAARLNGVLIKPGEEFKLMPTLGNIDAGSGYLPELVIKENKTIPEYGGGLCQIGTTLFRAALASGVQITARAPHAYRVSYYEPAGTDATIYDPWPDVRFINDTGNYILIQTKISGNIVTFDFWGTKDGRKIIFEGVNKTDDLTKLKPKIFNITSPGPAKIIETQELAPGKKKQTETAHNGADALFYRYITTASGEEKKETWSSHYKPWQAVILVGVEKPVDPAPIEGGSEPVNPLP